MKRWIKALVIVSMLVGLVGCTGGGTSKLPDDDSVKADVQEYIEEMIDSEGIITIFELQSNEVDNDTCTAKGKVLFDGSNGQQQGNFTLIYKQEGKTWELSKCRVDVDSETGTKQKGTEDKKDEEDEEKKSSVPISEVELSETLYDFTFELDGFVYQLPFAYTTLRDNGWTITSTGTSEDGKVQANSYEMVWMAKNGSQIITYVINMGGNTKSIKDCKVGGIEIDQNRLTDAQLFTLGKGINTTSAQDDITAAFGTPNDTRTSTMDTSVTLTYEKDIYEEVEFYIGEDPKYSRITMKNFVSDESDVTETSEEVPDYLSEYVQPTKLGDDILSGVFQLGDELYVLPVPLQVLLDDGWTMAAKPDAVGAGNTNWDVRLEKDGARIYPRIKNFADYQTIPENCAICDLQVDQDSGINLKLPKGISIGSTRDEVEAAKTDDLSYDKGTYNYTYSYYNYGQGRDLSIRVGIDSSKVESISLSGDEWN